MISAAAGRRRSEPSPRTTPSLFGDDPELDKLRDAYAIPANAIRDPERHAQLNAFFFWASWACVDEPARRRDHLHQQLAAPRR